MSTFEVEYKLELSLAVMQLQSDAKSVETFAGIIERRLQGVTVSGGLLAALCIHLHDLNCRVGSMRLLLRVIEHLHTLCMTPGTEQLVRESRKALRAAEAMWLDAICSILRELVVDMEPVREALEGYVYHVDKSTSECPRCFALHEDLSQIGVQHCQHCGYCEHPTTLDGVCGLCGVEIVTHDESATAIVGVEGGKP